MADVLDDGALASLLAMVGDDPDFVDELIDEYLSDAPRQLAAMHAAMATASAADLVRPAHTLKGTSLSVGAVQVAEACRSAEEMARLGDLDGARPYVIEAETAFAAVGDALSEARGRRWQPA